MIQPKTKTVELFSRLGKVGSISAWDPWESRKSVAHAKFWVSKVASLSYGNEAAANPEKLFQSIVDRGHLSCLEFVPVQGEWGGALPEQSLRQHVGLLDIPEVWEEDALEEIHNDLEASAFLVSCPLYTRSQWMRHRSFSYLEMSRRYTKGSKVAWEFYGKNEGGFSTEDFHKACLAEYQRRMDAGYPPELARGAIPMEAMTTFFVAGFDRDWEAFLKLRADPHAQPEIQAFAFWIKDYIASKGTK